MATQATKGGQAKGAITVATTAELVAAFAAGHTVEEIAIASVDVAAMKAEGHAAGLEEGKASLAEATTKAAADATAAERKRVTGLQSIAMKGFETEVQKAIESGASVEATAVEITKLGRTRGTTVASIAGDAPGAVRHGGNADGELAAKGGWGKITGRMKKKAGAR